MPLLQHLLFNEGQGAPALPTGTSLLGQQGSIGPILLIAVAAVVKGLPAGAVEPVEDFTEPELRMLPSLDQSILP